MADQERDEPSLELEMPRLRLRRPRRKPRAEEPAIEPEPAPVPAPASAPVPAQPRGEQATVLEAPPVADAPPTVRAPRFRPTLRLPGGWPAVVVTGAVVGLVVVALTWASLRTCEAVQGTATCGTAGYPMLALVLVIAVLVGATLLRLAQVPDPVSTSILGVGVAAVLALVFLIDHLDQAAMVIVIPVICAATYAGSHWLTTAVIEPDDR